MPWKRSGRTRREPPPARPDRMRRPMELSWTDVAAWRARRHRLHERAPADAMLSVVDELCGVQAQVMSSAELTLWARLESLDPDAVSTALWEDRTLVKTWAMRGTLHLLPASDYAFWQAALSTQFARFLKPSWSRSASRRTSWKRWSSR